MLPTSVNNYLVDRFSRTPVVGRLVQPGDYLTYYSSYYGNPAMIAMQDQFVSLYQPVPSRMPVVRAPQVK